MSSVWSGRRSNLRPSPLGRDLDLPQTSSLPARLDYATYAVADQGLRLLIGLLLLQLTADVVEREEDVVARLQPRRQVHLHLVVEIGAPESQSDDVKEQPVRDCHY